MSRFRRPHHINYAVSITITEDDTYLIIRRRKARRNKILQRERVFVGRLIAPSTMSISQQVTVLQAWVRDADLEKMYDAMTIYPPQLTWEIGNCTLSFDASMKKMVREMFTLKDFYTIFGRFLGPQPVLEDATLP